MLGGVPVLDEVESLFHQLQGNRPLWRSWREPFSVSGLSYAK
jgi:hypothetical protein